jgi:hypothetical protein
MSSNLVACRDCGLSFPITYLHGEHQKAGKCLPTKRARLIDIHVQQHSAAAAAPEVDGQTMGLAEAAHLAAGEQEDAGTPAGAGQEWHVDDAGTAEEEGGVQPEEGTEGFDPSSSGWGLPDHDGLMPWAPAQQAGLEPPLSEKLSRSQLLEAFISAKLSRTDLETLVGLLWDPSLSGTPGAWVTDKRSAVQMRDSWIKSWGSDNHGNPYMKVVDLADQLGSSRPVELVMRYDTLDAVWELLAKHGNAAQLTYMEATNELGERCIGEFYTAEKCCREEAAVNGRRAEENLPPAGIVWLILYSDATQVYSGNARHNAHPLYLSLGEL